MSDHPAHITFTIDCDFTLSPEEIFPDGVPEDWSLADVVAAVKQCRSLSEWLSDWFVDATLRVIVDKPNPAWAGDDVLFGDPPPRRLVEWEDVW